ncbi:MAG: glucose-6-phosphate dehydrogenase [bacterium]
MIRHLVIFGAAGDLTSRFLMPALASLQRARKLPRGFTILGISRQDFGVEKFRRYLLERQPRDGEEQGPRLPRSLLRRLRYRSADVLRPSDIAAALNPIKGPIVAYLALPADLFAPAVRAIAAAGPAAGSRIVVEKPFGESLRSARALNRLLAETFPPDAVYRMDHFLGKQTVQNILGLRFANRLFEPVWSRRHVRAVEILWEETLALEGRAAYYDKAGALRDLIQNHLLQLLTLVAMEPPATLDARHFRDRKVALLRRVRRLRPKEVRRLTVRARYGAGTVEGRRVPAYVDEEGVDPAQATETFAQVVLFVNDRRWAGVPFILRTGKALGRERREIAVTFREVTAMAFGERAGPRPNVLRFQIDPDRMALDLNVNGAGDPFDLEDLTLQADLVPQDLPAYARLLLDVLEGDPTFSIRGDEAEESWRIVEPILTEWAAHRVPLRAYAAGSEGPGRGGRARVRGPKARRRAARRGGRARSRSGRSGRSTARPP